MVKEVIFYDVFVGSHVNCIKMAKSSVVYVCRKAAMLPVIVKRGSSKHLLLFDRKRAKVVKIHGVERASSKRKVVPKSLTKSRRESIQSVNIS